MNPIILHTKQQKALNILNNNTYTRILFSGASRSGKTLCVVLWALNKMATIPGIRIVMLRQHRVHARSSLFEPTIKPLLVDRSEFIISENNMTITHNNGSIMYISGLDDDKNVEKIMGSEFYFAIIDEATQVSYKAYKILTSRLSQSLEGVNLPRKLILMCNPKAPTHWIYQIFMNKIDPDGLQPLENLTTYKYSLFNLLDNESLPQDTIDSIKNLTGVEHARLAEGRWVAADNLVYPEFVIEKHIKDITIPQEVEYVIGIDVGLNDPVVIGLWAIFNQSEEIKQMHLVSLYYEQGKNMSLSISDYCEQFKHLNPYIVVDPSASSAIIELKNKEFKVEPANNKILDGVKNVKDLLLTNRVTFSPKYKDIIIEEFSTYELNPNTEKPIQGTKDHFLDMLKYSTWAYQDVISTQKNNFYIFA